MTRPRLTAADLAEVERILAPADAALARGYPGDPSARQPVHTLYVPADRVVPGLVKEHGRTARAVLDEHAPEPAALARAVGADPDQVAAVWPLLLRWRARARAGRGPPDRPRGRLPRALRRGGGRPRRGGGARRGGRAPAVLGRALQVPRGAHPGRGLRTLDLAIGAALEDDGLPDGFQLTLPKVTSVEQVLAMATACERLEAAYCLRHGRLRFEVQVETPQAVLGADGTATVARLVHAAQDGATACTSGPTTTPPRSGSPPASRRWTTRPPTTPRTSCRWPPPAPASRSATAPPTCCRSGRPGRSTRRGRCTSGWYAARSSAACTRAGTCTRPSCRPASWRTSCSSAMASSRRRPGARLPRRDLRRGARRARDGPRADELPAARPVVRRGDRGRARGTDRDLGVAVTADLAVAGTVLVEGAFRDAVVVVTEGRIVAVEPPDVAVAAVERVRLRDDEVLLPGLVDTHVHVNEPGRTEWEGYASATRAAAAGGVTTLVDMPLNSIPPTVDVAALDTKRAAAAGQCHVDVGFWGGAVPGSLGGLGALADAGVLGFKCFLVDSGVPEFPPLDRGPARPGGGRGGRAGRTAARARRGRRGCSPPRAAVRGRPRTPGSWRSRPPRPRTPRSRCCSSSPRGTGARVHVVHLSSAAALPALARGPRRRGAGDRRDLPALPDTSRGGGPRRRDRVQVLPADPRRRQPRGAVGARWPTAPSTASCPTTRPRHADLKRLDAGRLRRGLGRGRVAAARAAADLDRRATARPRPGRPWWAGCPRRPRRWPGLARKGAIARAATPTSSCSRPTATFEVDPARCTTATPSRRTPAGGSTAWSATCGCAAAAS